MAIAGRASARRRTIVARVEIIALPRWGAKQSDLTANLTRTPNST
jgi:hypothetical protein